MLNKETAKQLINKAAKSENKPEVKNDYISTSVSVSSDGTTAIVGTCYKTSHTGAVYIFTREGDTWNQQAKLEASDKAGSDQFGSSVSISSDGNTAIVGAQGKASGTGAAYIFTRTGSTWSQQAKLEASDKATYDYFGWSVSISSDGNTAIVGAPYKASLTGAAYIFTRTGSTWSQQAKLEASDKADNDQFGRSVSISSDGNTAIVGANGKASFTGAAYIFTRTGSTWSQQAKLEATDKANSDYFGYSVSISSDGNTAIVGAFYKDSVKETTYTFTRDGDIWSYQAILEASYKATN